jgi:hypothetical protein
MAVIQFLPMLVAFAAAASAPKVDLNEIERSIAKEPAYQTRLPKYCLLVFGREAKTRIWLVLDGTSLYIDRNGNGDLTETGECVSMKGGGKWLDAQLGQFRDEAGKMRELSLRIRDFDAANGKCSGMMILLDNKRKQFVGFDEANPFRFAQQAQDAPIIHVEGPLVTKLYGEPPTLVAGQEVELNVTIGTPGVGPGSFCAIQCCTVLNCKVSPVAAIELPRRDPHQTPLHVRVPIADD